MTTLYKDEYAYRVVDGVMYCAEADAETLKFGQFLPMDAEEVRKNDELLKIYLMLYE